MFAFVLLIGMGLFFYTYYSDNIISVLILSRFSDDSEKGIAGNNITKADFDYYYENTVITSSNNLLWGGGQKVFDKFPSGNQSYTVFIAAYGMISLILLFIFYVSMCIFVRSELILGFLIFYCISFMQRTYALWDMEVFLFIGATELFGLQKAHESKPFQNVKLYSKNVCK
jgi:hypothetical protein